jgi:hypothetical protein
MQPEVAANSVACGQGEKSKKKKQKPRNNGKKSAVLHTATCASRLEKRWSIISKLPTLSEQEERHIRGK